MTTMHVPFSLEHLISNMFTRIGEEPTRETLETLNKNQLVLDLFNVIQHEMSSYYVNMSMQSMLSAEQVNTVRIQMIAVRSVLNELRKQAELYREKQHPIQQPKSDQST